MKKVLFAVVLVAMSMNAKAQWFSLESNCDYYQLGLNLGSAGFGTEYAGFGFGASLAVWGVYIDCLVNPPASATDNHVKDELWPDQEAFVVNVGYQIPILPWLRLTPLIGYSQTNYGFVDASTVNVNVDSQTSTGHISHDYNPVERFHEVNFGAGIFVQPIEEINLYAVATRRAIYGGVSFVLNEFK